MRINIKHKILTLSMVLTMIIVLTFANDQNNLSKNELDDCGPIIIEFGLYVYLSEFDFFVRDTISKLKSKNIGVDSVINITINDKHEEFSVKGTLKNQLREGIWTTYLNERQIIRTQEFKNDKLHGAEFLFYLNPNDGINRLRQYVNGSRHGNTYLFANNMITSITPYKNDIPHGIKYYFDCHGNKVEEVILNDNHITGRTLFYPNGNIKETGKYEHYVFTDTLKSIPFFTRVGEERIRKINKRFKTGIWRYYEHNGSLLRVEYHENFELHVDKLKED